MEKIFFLSDVLGKYWESQLPARSRVNWKAMRKDPSHTFIITQGTVARLVCAEEWGNSSAHFHAATKLIGWFCMQLLSCRHRATVSIRFIWQKMPFASNLVSMDPRKGSAYMQQNTTAIFLNYRTPKWNELTWSAGSFLACALMLLFRPPTAGTSTAARHPPHPTLLVAGSSKAVYHFTLASFHLAIKELHLLIILSHALTHSLWIFSRRNPYFSLFFLQCLCLLINPMVYYYSFITTHIPFSFLLLNAFSNQYDHITPCFDLQSRLWP